MNLKSSALKAGARLYVISRIVVQMRPVREFSIKLSFTCMKIILESFQRPCIL